MYKCKWECSHTGEKTCCRNCKEICDKRCEKNPEHCDSSIECTDEEDKYENATV